MKKIKYKFKKNIIQGRMEIQIESDEDWDILSQYLEDRSYTWGSDKSLRSYNYFSSYKYPIGICLEHHLVFENKKDILYDPTPLIREGKNESEYGRFVYFKDLDLTS